jgi:orotidine-5'-phosphate decarboxylase
MNERVIVALDRSEWPALEKLTQALQGSGCTMKVGMELYYAHGNRAVEYIAKLGFKIFLDLKLHDIPTTVHKSVLNLSQLPIHMLNVHAAGGVAMMRAAHEARQNTNPKLKLIAVTQLTSTSAQALKDELLIDRSMEQVVLHYARHAQTAGLDGVVCSPLEVMKLKTEISRDFICVTPGVRPAGSHQNDQVRTMTPTQALMTGSDWLVVGRPITEANDPRQALESLFKE